MIAWAVCLTLFYGMLFLLFVYLEICFFGLLGLHSIALHGVSGGYIKGLFCGVPINMGFRYFG